MLDRLLDPSAQLRTEIAAEQAVAEGFAREIGGEGGGDHHVVEPLPHVLAHRGIAEPPGRDVG
jgi:hypothetical protein